MKILINLTLDGTYFAKTVEWPAVPRMGEQVNLTEGGWSEEVSRVWWPAEAPDDPVQVELGDHRDAHGESLADALRLAGWSDA